MNIEKILIDMSIVKIQSVRRTKQAVDYILKESKTMPSLIDTYKCDEETILEDFNDLLNERNQKLNTGSRLRTKMIIQSFGKQDNVTAEEAHQYGKSLAEKYLKGDHQYVLATHLDGNHIHNHIIFNEIKLNDLLMFNNRRVNTIDRLRVANDEISRENNLYIPKERKHENKIIYMQHREIRARKRGTSFKEDLENAIDTAIEVSESYEEFIQIMEEKGYEYKEGRHLGFKNKERKYFMRTRTLGFHYDLNSIKYRIENKDFEIEKFKYSFDTELIDKSQKKFRENYGLRKWASKQNLIHLQKISHLVFNEGKTLEEIEEMQSTEKEFIKNVENTLLDKDSLIYDLEKKVNAFQDYKDSASVMVALKNAEDKREFKSKNFKAIMKHDVAKKNITILKNKYNIRNENDFNKVYKDNKAERDQIYNKYSEIIKERNKGLSKDKAMEEEEKKREEEQRDKGLRR